MASMNPILRVRRAFRALGANSAQADEVASAIDAIYPTRREFKLQMEEMMARHRRELLIEIIVIFSIAVGIIIAFVS